MTIPSSDVTGWLTSQHGHVCSVQVLQSCLFWYGRRVLAGSTLACVNPLRWVTMFVWQRYGRGPSGWRRLAS